MITNINPYLSFDGNCEEAMNFYASVLGGKLEPPMYYGDSPMTAPGYEKKVMHVTMHLGNSFLMGSDATPQMPAMKGSAVQISTNWSDKASMTTAFNKLTEGGMVTMPLQDTFWGSHFGMCIDKYGFVWFFSYDAPKS